jgi:hypothetical protein
VHGVTYFAPESRAALDALGYRGFWMGYFAARSAPLGMVPPEVVTALFYNFAPSRVAKALSGAWSVTGPDQALRARAESSVAALRRYGVTDGENVRVAGELAAKAAQSLSLGGHPMFASNKALPWPDDPVASLWHSATLLREHRGDTHIAVLAAEGISGRACNVLHSASGKVPREYMMVARDYDESEWQAHVDALTARGLLDGDGALTVEGRALNEQIETRTDSLALSALDVLDDAEVEALFAALTPITRQVLAGGDIPEMTPMGLGRDDLKNDRAGLG